MTTQTLDQTRAGQEAEANMAPKAAPKWPDQIFQKLREAEVTQVTYVPDAGHARLIDLCHQDSDMKTTVLTTEEEGIGVLAGAWLGGDRGVLLMQSSGVGNCINTLSMARVCGFPLVMIVTMRGQWGEANPWQLFEEAGFPKGVMNVVTGFGSEVGEPLVAHPKVAKIAFTGGEMGGQKVYESAARGLKTVTLELGGKSPNIVFDDAVIEDAVKGVISGIFAATGQTCIAGSRLLVQKSIEMSFTEKLVKFAATARMGDPMNLETQVGPVTTRQQYDKILGYIDIAKREGARLALGGAPAKRPECGSGWFVEPTIFAGVNNQMRIAREEVFGPVLSVIPFEDEEDAVAIANDSPYGLAAGVWTSSIKRAIRTSERLEAGSVWVNTYRAVSYMSPFGGYKRSGLGRENGQDAVWSYLQTKSVWISTADSVANPFVLR